MISLLFVLFTGSWDIQYISYPDSEVPISCVNTFLSMVFLLNKFATCH